MNEDAYQAVYMLLLPTLGRFLAFELWRWPAALTSISIFDFALPGKSLTATLSSERGAQAPSAAGGERDVAAWDARFACQPCRAVVELPDGAGAARATVVRRC